MGTSPFEIAHYCGGALDPPIPPLRPGLASLSVEVVRPGEPVRIVNVLDAVQPSAKAEPGSSTFPGMLGPARGAGSGRTLVVDGVAVLPTCDFAKSHDLALLPERPDGASIIDMAGPGASYSPWAATANVVLSFEADPDAGLTRADLAIRRVTMEVARDLAATMSGTPDHIERFPEECDTGSLPKVVAIVHVGAQGPLLDTFLYGKSLRDAEPTIVTPAELADGALTNGHYDWAALRNPTFSYQGGRLLARLRRDHGTEIAFVGVIVTRAYATTLEEKRANSQAVARSAVSLGARCAVITTFQSGNSQTDTMLAIEACEERGIRTTGIISETDDGLTDHLPAADCLVSVGNEDDSVSGWAPDRIVGGDPEPRPGGVRTPVLAYLGAMSQLGDGRLTSVRS